MGSKSSAPVPVPAPEREEWLELELEEKEVEVWLWAMKTRKTLLVSIGAGYKTMANVILIVGHELAFEKTFAR